MPHAIRLTALLLPLLLPLHAVARQESRTSSPTGKRPMTHASTSSVQISRAVYGTHSQGGQVDLFTLTNAKGMKATLTTFGAKLEAFAEYLASQGVA